MLMPLETMLIPLAASLLCDPDVGGKAPVRRLPIFT